ncbi:hypothetical protein [Chryseobacterium sp. CFBP8996]|uniref:hypothetical protein n=1 Tax=Chryseobacterium sp. CFBP8996 TaxID=3096529 RepID=UPI002A6B66C3|nr:hypothetical protein [Chryseobacterium sp. CFBP8996]MDY0929572.1 hypothetical protein [Chryseobacterium sp. CFBP8996]
MKKILLTAILLSSVTFQAQQTLDDNTFFTNLIGKQFENVPSEHPNYRISNKLITNVGWVLDTFWWGGIQFETHNHIKLKSRYGTVYVSETGNTGVNTEDPQHTLDVHGDFRVTSNNNYFLYNLAGNLVLKNNTNGQGGRVIVHDTGNTLSLNYNNDFTGGTKIGSTFLVKGDNASLQGKLEAKEIKVTLTPTADFVFAEDYDLPKLEDIEKHIKEKKHLPEIASAKQMEKEGVNVGEFQIKLLQKIEELTLYTIEQNKLVKEQQKRIETLEKNSKSKK